jgi:hypothetical protein
MDVLTITTTAAVGVIASAITAYITVRINSKHERKKFEREIASKMAEYRDPPGDRTMVLAVQFAEGFLIVDRKSELDREKYFLPSGCRITLGRDRRNHIVVDSPFVSRIHVAFRCGDSEFWVETLGASNPVALNDKVLNSSSKLKHGDRISIPAFEDLSITFEKLTR